MIVDCHTHLGRNEHINASVDQLLKSMDKAGIDQSLVFAGDMNDAPNNWTLEQVHPHRDRLKAVVGAYPLKFNTHAELFKDASKLADLYQAGDIVAVKFYTGYDHYYPADRATTYYLDQLEDVGCPAIFHSGDCLNSIKHAKLKYAHPLHIDEVAVDYPKMNFIIAHMGFPWVKDTAEVCYKNDNVYTDISGFVYGEFRGLQPARFKHNIIEFLHIAGSDKLLFGTDWPISDQKSYRSVVDDLFGEGPNVWSMTQNVRRAFKLP